MQRREFHLAIVVTALSLGTAWAVRGKFGHEQGAAWAGAIGALSLIIVANRGDWYKRAFTIALAAAVGWGMGGMMSYGMVVGYGRGTDFGNVLYGLLMLFVIGFLHGVPGGGLIGLACSDRISKSVNWPALITEMIAFGLLFYGLFVYQLGWLMTPPRSELWAVCLGASVALVWYMQRNGYTQAMRMSLWSGLGAGFGFAFGNFLQVVGSAAEINFINLWNVMEYSIGFFGGAGLAYATFSAPWDRYDDAPEQPQALPLILVTLFIPLVVWQQSFEPTRFDFVLAQGYTSSTITLLRMLALISIVVVGVLIFMDYRRSTVGNLSAGFAIRRSFFSFLILYIVLSFFMTGVVRHPSEQYLYILNVIAIVMLMSMIKDPFELRMERPGRWMTATLIIFAAIVLFSIIAISSHDGMRGSQVRFGSDLPAKN